MQTLEQLLAGELKGSTRLKLSCGLTHFPEEILDLADTLEILDLSGNRLTQLPADFARLKNLKITFFSDNDFTHFPAVLGQCPQLEMIGFKACQLQHIPEEAIPVATRWLILTNNQITALPASIGKCTRLQKLMLAGNRLTHLPEALAHCQNLELLRISANKLTQLPDWLFSLPRLSWLAFAGNPFSQKIKTPHSLPAIPWSSLELEEQLGEGASGVISRAHWQTPLSGAANQQVAVKVFKGEVTSDGLPEDEIMACMAAGPHPNLVQVLGTITDHPEQKQGLVLDLIPTGYRNLGGPPSFATCTRDTFPQGTNFTRREVLSIAAGIASAAAHLHAQGILHGDLYAHNTLVDENAHALFGDFGAATLYDKTAPEAAVLERLEVRAYGYLLEDLLDHFHPSAAEQEVAQRLLQLKNSCLQPEAFTRPNFSSIMDQLAAISKAE
ncbi:leucine-rich repeat-containing protein kinase family protein [Rufibacter soli]